MYKLYFSPSDQTENRYAVGDTNEAAVCRKVAQKCVDAATRCGFAARTNVTDNSGTAMQSRVAESNAWGADAHIPIHTNAFNGEVAGTRMFCFDTTGEGYRLCAAILARVAPITPGTSDNITPHLYYEVKYANAPTAYLEVGFHDNAEEAAWLAAHTSEVAEAIVQGCCDHFGVAYTAPGASVPKTPTPEKATLYRVRKSWADAASQLGAFAQLENAKRLADQNPGYAVFDENGNAVYTPEQKPQTYTVQKGDSLWTIAERQLGNGLRYPEIMRLNGLNSTTIYAGQTLEIPEK